MVAAWLLTLFAFAGIAFAVFLGRSQTVSPQLAAAGGGLLAGLSLCWILPEVAEAVGWLEGVSLAGLSVGLLFGLDGLLDRAGHSRWHSLARPLLAAAAIHSFVDGWSVRVLSINPLASIAVPLGLALHKIPEGLALGLVSRRSIAPAWKAFAAGACVEALTVVGAVVEPRADGAGVARFGSHWTGTILAIIGGSFLFLGIHTVWPERRKKGVLTLFLSAFAAAAIVAAALGRFGLE
jgi:zinc transporter ZupT